MLVSDARPSPDRAGSLIAGRYELASVIGEGGHGMVWKARDTKTGNDVAVKMLNDVAARDPQQVERLKREQQALVALAGTHAVGVIDLGRAPGGRLCLVMELLEGTDLEDHLAQLEQRGRRMAIRDLVAVLDPVVATLERAHQAGIVHRDLKPANVFVLAGGGVRLLDFGLARLRRAAPLTAAGMILGSPSYIAPEIWKGGALDQRVDIYSLGVIVFRALAGHVPFEGKTLQQKFIAATTAERPSLRALRSDLSSEIDDWVAEVLAIDPAQRFHAIRGAWNALLAVLGAAELAPRLVTAEDLASASQAAAPFVAAGPRGVPSELSLLTAPSAVREPSGARERSVWLSQDDLLEEPPAAPPPPPVRVVPSPIVAPRTGGDFAPVPLPFGAAPPGAAGEAIADDQRSFVREWLAPTQWDADDGAGPSASQDVIEWLGGPSKDGSTTQRLKAIRLPPEEDEPEAAASVPAPATQRLPRAQKAGKSRKRKNRRKRRRRKQRRKK